MGKPLNVKIENPLEYVCENCKKQFYVGSTIGFDDYQCYLCGHDNTENVTKQAAEKLLLGIIQAVQNKSKEK